MKSCLYVLRYATITLSVWAYSGIALAQRSTPPEAPSPGGKSYVVSYMVVVLAIALGLLVVCRSGGRSNEPKLDDLE